MDDAGNSRQVEDVLQRVFSAVLANESSLASMSNPKNADLMPSDVIAQRREALANGFSADLLR